MEQPSNRLPKWTATLDWQEYYESISREYYLKGPELDKQLPVGKYKIEVYSGDNQGKYVLVVGKNDVYDYSVNFKYLLAVAVFKSIFFTNINFAIFSDCFSELP